MVMTEATFLWRALEAVLGAAAFAAAQTSNEASSPLKLVPTSWCEAKRRYP